MYFQKIITHSFEGTHTQKFGALGHQTHPLTIKRIYCISFSEKIKGLDRDLQELELQVEDSNKTNKLRESLRWDAQENL